MTAPAQLDACALHECFIYDGPLPRRPKGWRHNAGYQPGAIGRQTTVLSSRYGINLLCCEAWLNG